MTRAEREELRRRIDSVVRARNSYDQTAVCEYPHLAGTSSYAYGCRCPRCRTASTETRRERWNREKARERERAAS